MTLDADYEGVQKMKDAAKTTIDEVLKAASSSEEEMEEGVVLWGKT